MSSVRPGSPTSFNHSKPEPVPLLTEEQRNQNFIEAMSIGIPCFELHNNLENHLTAEEFKELDRLYLKACGLEATLGSDAYAAVITFLDSIQTQYTNDKSDNGQIVQSLFENSSFNEAKGPILERIIMPPVDGLFTAETATRLMQSYFLS